MFTATKSEATALKGANVNQTQSQGALTRQDIALAIYDRFGSMSRREAKRIVDSVIEEMVETLTSGESLKLHDFGSFVVRAKHKRAGRNPRTGAPVPIRARRVVVFKASPNMKATVNGELTEARGDLDQTADTAKSAPKKDKAPAVRHVGHNLAPLSETLSE